MFQQHLRAEGILLSISSNNQLLIINFAYVPGLMSKEIHTCTKPRSLAEIKNLHND